MPILNETRNLTNLIKLTKAGFSVASYLEIKEAIQTRYKEIYGSDIDLSTNTSDGIFVENICLMINNILQSFKVLYDNLDIRVASGEMLEALCALTGIYRSDATKSVAYLKLTNNSSTPIIIDSENQISFVDQSGLIWSTSVGDGINSKIGTEITLVQDEPQSLPVYCEITGPIVATKGWINQLLTSNINLSFEQITDAIIGSNKETDNELREKRNNSINSYGLTVVSNLIGSLLAIGGIDDVYVYNNNTNDYIHSLDNTFVNARSVYIITKQSVDLDDSIIGEVIYNKMTPGIPTTDGLGNFGEPHTYLYNENESLKNYVYWKRAEPIQYKVSISINLNKFKGFDINKLESNLTNYINSFSINKNFTNYDLMSYLNLADPMFNGLKTYQIYGIDITYVGTGETPFNKTVESDSVTYVAKDTYFNLSGPEVDEVSDSIIIIEYDDRE